MYTPGVITVAYYTDDDGTCGRAGPAVIPETSQIAAGAIWLKVGCATRPFNTTTMVHELGYALGYGHVTRAPSVMRPAGGLDVTDFDLAAAAIVFRRPAGNRAPDTDPDTFRINGTSSLSTGGPVVILPPMP
jgi:hypothetical protein